MSTLSVFEFLFSIAVPTIDFIISIQQTVFSYSVSSIYFGLSLFVVVFKVVYVQLYMNQSHDFIYWRGEHFGFLFRIDLLPTYYVLFSQNFIWFFYLVCLFICSELLICSHYKQMSNSLISNYKLPQWF